MEQKTFEINGKKYRPLTWEERGQVEGRCVILGSFSEWKYVEGGMKITTLARQEDGSWRTEWGFSDSTLCENYVFEDTRLPVGVEV